MISHFLQNVNILEKDGTCENGTRKKVHCAPTEDDINYEFEDHSRMYVVRKIILSLKLEDKN